MGQTENSSSVDLAKPPAEFRERVRVFNANRSSISIDELHRCRDQWVAFRWDGTAIVAGDPDIDVLVQRLIDSGIDPHRDVMYEWVSDERTAHAGGIEVVTEAVSSQATSA
jgi:hypothetical protein